LNLSKYIENFFSEALRSNANLKKKLKFIYQSFWMIISSKKFNFVNSNTFIIKDCFGGFHNLNVFNFKNTVCALRFIGPRKKVNINESVEVIVSKYPYSSQIKIGTTSAFNWQQGSRLQFYEESKLLYNVIIDDKLQACSVCIDSMQKFYLDFPVYAVGSMGGNIFAACNFKNIEDNMPGYGYRGEYKEKIKSNSIYLFDKHSKIKSKIFLELDEGDFITHLEFSLDDRYISFFKRTKLNLNDYRSTLCVYTIDGLLVTAINNFDYITHFAWFEDRLLFFGKENDARSGNYYWYCLNNKNILKASDDLPDGHPTYSNGISLTDTYPDRSRVQRLKLLQSLDSHAMNCIDIAEVTIPIRYTEDNRVDFHPRLNHDGTLYSIDVAHKEGVDMYIGELSA